jgi:MFS family permease
MTTPVTELANEPANRWPTDVRLLFAGRFVRMFAYGFLSVLLLAYLTELGLSAWERGLLMSLILVGDIGVSLFLTTTADRFGRRRTLIIGAILMLLAGVAFALTNNFILLLIAATIGVISPSGNEVGPFLSVEQAGLSQVIPDQRRTHIFGWYTLAGSLATAFGALASGQATQALQNAGVPTLDSLRVIVWGYAAAGAILAVMFLGLSRRVEVAPAAASKTAGARAFLGLHKSKGVVAKLSALFSIDAFAGGFVLQSLLAAWFLERYNVHFDTLGWIFFGANILAALSALAAAKVAAKIGLINTMVFTHLPSNVLLILVPLMPNMYLAIAMFLLRFSISQMDVPARQSYVMAVVEPDERSAAGGVTAVARSVGASVSPSLATLLLATPLLMAAPFFIGGGLKIVYDLLVYRAFSAKKDQMEAKDGKAKS